MNNVLNVRDVSKHVYAARSVNCCVNLSTRDLEDKNPSASDVNGTAELSGPPNFTGFAHLRSELLRGFADTYMLRDSRRAFDMYHSHETTITRLHGRAKKGRSGSDRPPVGDCDV